MWNLESDVACSMVGPLALRPGLQQCRTWAEEDETGPGRGTRITNEWPCASKIKKLVHVSITGL